MMIKKRNVFESLVLFNKPANLKSVQSNIICIWHKMREKVISGNLTENMTINEYKWAYVKIYHDNRLYFLSFFHTGT